MFGKYILEPVFLVRTSQTNKKNVYNNADTVLSLCLWRPVASVVTIEIVNTI